ncbi:MULTISPECIES: alginate export family protein [Brevundimonas]|uniref:alginate export family protein n=1 Tax=Brevundimonas pishanensis TaxID=2896315 RepID=UPI001FA7E701|nr:alginate export family protein [Brevundimonas pishanensis]
MLLSTTAAAALLLSATPAAATAAVTVQTPAPPLAPVAFKPLNVEDDWSRFADPATRTTPWSKLKYIPVAGDAWLSLGGEARWRAEYRGNERFGRGAQDDDGDLQQRLRLWGDLHVNNNVRVFVELQDGRSHGLDSGETITEENRTDFHQAFIETEGKFAGGRTRLRVGRQEFGIGSMRLFEPREGGNARVALDIARVIYDNPNGWSGGAFAGYGIREAKTSFDNRTNHDYRLIGAHAGRKLGEGATAPKLELLYVNTDRMGMAFDTGLAGRDDRHTVSVRLDGRHQAWDYDVEGVIQRGDFRGLDIEAWYVSANAGYSFNHAWSPRLGVRIDAASGDKDRADGKLNTYNQLNQPPISMRTDFGVSNLVTIQPQLTFKPNPKTTVGLFTAGLWRQSNEDGVYALSGMPIRSGVEGTSSYVGWRNAAFVTRVLNPHLSVTGVVNHTTAGDFLKETGTADDQSYVGAWLTAKF